MIRPVILGLTLTFAPAAEEATLVALLVERPFIMMTRRKDVSREVRELRDGRISDKGL